MLPGRHDLSLALLALRQHRAQAALAILGVMVGVGALVTSLALGRGAQEAIRDQLLAAGVNMIVVTAGNYAVERPQKPEGPAGHANLHLTDPEAIQRVTSMSHPTTSHRSTRLLPAVWHPTGGSLAQQLDAYESASAFAKLERVHYEDDPFAEHDHPTAKERLGDAMAGLGAAATLTLDDAAAIRDMPGVEFVAAGVHENARISVAGDKSKQWFTRLHGTDPELPRIRRGWTYPFGSFLSSRHARNAEQVMVLGRVVADQLFGPTVDPVGRVVLLWNQQFRIIGVVGSRSWATQPVAGDDQFDAVYVPVQTVHKLLNLSKLNTITVTTASAGDTTRIAGEIVQLLRDRHGISDIMPDDFTVRTQAQQLLGKGLAPDLARVVAGNMKSVDRLTIEELSDSLQRANWTMYALLASVAAVSLVVGGIGVMNVLLLSVTQRTREVGLRIAMGARRADIRMQFLLEAVFLCVVGGVLGALAGAVGSAGIEGIFEWSAVFSPLSAVIAICVAVVLGIASGFYPARRAAQLDPIEALRYE